VTWLPQESIRIKRDGGALESDDLARIARAIADGSLSDAQVGAFVMAVQLRGMTAAECAAFTRAVRDSGEVFNWRAESPPGPVLDKHSTGGVGDLVSLALGPMLAACGAWVPMVVGRGLAHTGGTLDKLESIPGYQSRPPPERVRRAVREAGVAIVGAGDRIAPADRRLYAIRDVTATVDCLPLQERGRELARAMISTAAASGLPMSALLTDMSEPLARSAGNALEVHEAIAMLCGETSDPRLLEVTLALGQEVMLLGKLAKDAKSARSLLTRSITSGAAAERFSRMVASLGGPGDILDKPDAHLAKAAIVVDVAAARDGVIAAIDTRAVGFAVVTLGGGRIAPDHSVDHSVGFDRLLPLGTAVQKGEPIARVHASKAAAAEAAAATLSAAFTIGDGPPKARPLIERI
jgi:thymidine phosphorylase